MRIPKFLKPLLLAATLAIPAALSSASAASVYFENDSGQSGRVDVYVDGQLVFDNVFPATNMMFPRDIASGTHQIVVTPSNEAVGQQDVLRETVNIGNDGTYTLSLGQDQTAEGYGTVALDLSAGNSSN